jgi:hypothetical protein
MSVLEFFRKHKVGAAVFLLCIQIISGSVGLRILGTFGSLSSVTAEILSGGLCGSNGLRVLFFIIEAAYIALFVLLIDYGEKRDILKQWLAGFGALAVLMIIYSLEIKIYQNSSIIGFWKYYSGDGFSFSKTEAAAAVMLLFPAPVVYVFEYLAGIVVSGICWIVLKIRDGRK